MRYLPSASAPLARYRPPGAGEPLPGSPVATPASGNPQRTQKIASAALSREHDGQDLTIWLSETRGEAIAPPRVDGYVQWPARSAAASIVLIFWPNVSRNAASSSS